MKVREAKTLVLQLEVPAGIVEFNNTDWLSDNLCWRCKRHVRQHDRECHGQYVFHRRLGCNEKWIEEQMEADYYNRQAEAQSDIP